ncbi:hypothetical protein OIE75_41340 (plasmid) [Streptomyces sp. NBC_01723]|uniref:DUF7620 family protein n=1 Tax=Streptomyces sp. NBC_01723 TaxID=2975921 RepID=UPI002E3408F4|nr:hypothetical protein [Streptomyces sp. NBC_01723]
MRWISRLLRRRPEPAPQRPDQAAKTHGQREAEKALSRAQKARRTVEAHRPLVDRVAARLASEREQNHFAELFRNAFEGGPR